MNLQQRLVSSLMLASVLSGSCSSPKLHAKYQRELAAAEDLIVRGDRPEAVSELEALVVETSADPREYGLQRFFANLLLARVHLLASVDGPFLPEAESARARIGAIESMSGTSIASHASSTAHLTASALALGHAADWSDSVRRSSLEIDGTQLLPAGLAQGGVERALRELELNALVIDARLGFQNKVDRTLDATPALTDLAKCRAVLAETGYSEELTPWIYYSVFGYLRPRDEVRAFYFAVQTLGEKKSMLDTLPRNAANSIRTWIVEECTYEFRCPKCSTAIVPEYDDCQNCRVPTLQFRAVKKAGKGPAAPTGA